MIRFLFTLSIGIVTGIYMAQNYDLPRFSEDTASSYFTRQMEPHITQVKTSIDSTLQNLQTTQPTITKNDDAVDEAPTISDQNIEITEIQIEPVEQLLAMEKTTIHNNRQMMTKKDRIHLNKLDELASKKEAEERGRALWKTLLEEVEPK